MHRWPGFPISPYHGMPSANYNISAAIMARRRWEQVLPASIASQSQRVSVMSYNVLADELMALNNYLYERCPPYLFQFGIRSRGLIDEIIGHNPSVSVLLLNTKVINMVVTDLRLIRD